jgi:dTDP-4-dehydrorhamnose 3,5-epimerase-like enzyme
MKPQKANAMIRVLPTRFAEARLFEPEVFSDERGYFKETYSRQKYGAFGLNDTFVQDNVSRSRRNVIRGMHYDLRLAKFVRISDVSRMGKLRALRSEPPAALRPGRLRARLFGPGRRGDRRL